MGGGQFSASNNPPSFPRPRAYTGGMPTPSLRYLYEYWCLCIKISEINAAPNYTTLQVIDFFKLPIGAALVLVDEVALDFGQLRLKGKGGAGGHNGLKSLQAHLKTPEYSRLRIGVGGKGAGEGGRPIY